MVSRFFRFGPDDLSRDPEARDSFARADTAMDPFVRAKEYSAALARVTERAFVLPLYTVPTHYVANADLEFTPSADGRPRFYEMDWR